MVVSCLPTLCIPVSPLKSRQTFPSSFPLWAQTKNKISMTASWAYLSLPPPLTQKGLASPFPTVFNLGLFYLAVKRGLDTGFKGW